MKWNEEEDSWLIQNYSETGSQECSNVLGKSKSSIQNRVYKLGLKLSPDYKSKIFSKNPEECNVNPNLFYEINTKEIVYLLGLIWSDGHLNSSKNGRTLNIGFTMVTEDFKLIESTIMKTGKWNHYPKPQRTDTNWKPSSLVVTNNKRIYNFLKEHDFDRKSYVSADKILSKIPDELKHYFFRGLIDGDGCFYHHKPNKGSILRQFAIVSTFEQNWSYFENLCIELDIKYTIKRTKKERSSSSCLRITNKNGIEKLGSFVYENYNIDKIGLDRKYKKYIQIIAG
jgi:hypothetical protein